MDPHPESNEGPETRPKWSNFQTLPHLGSWNDDPESRGRDLEMPLNSDRPIPQEESFAHEKFSTEASDHGASLEFSGKGCFPKRRKVGLVVTLLNEKVSGRKGSFEEPRTDSDLMSSFKLEPFNQIRIRSYHFRSKLISKKTHLAKKRTLDPLILFNSSNLKPAICRVALDPSNLDIDDMSVFCPR